MNNRSKIFDYSVEVKKIIPLHRANINYQQERCYTGVSLSNPFFRGDGCFAFLNWINKNFRSCTIFIDDYFHQFNERAFTGNSIDSCLYITKKMAYDVQKHLQDVIDNTFDEAYKFKIITSSSLSANEDYKKNSLFFNNLFFSSLDFKKGVEISALDYIHRQSKRQNHFMVSDTEALNLSCKYLIEEIAVFTTLCEQGYLIEVYPGAELPILVDIADGKFENIPSALLKRTNIELKLKKKK